MTPRITVLVPTYDRAEYLAECLDSLFAQSIVPSQVIVVNDGSTDRTLEVLKSYRGRIDYLETPQGGKSVSINRGLEIVNGDYLWIFDDDDVALPDALERFVTPLEKEPRYGFSYSTYYFTATKPGSRLIGRVLFEEKKPDLKKRGFLIPLLESNTLGGAALFARMSCYRATGMFDPALVRSQDYDMAIRIARRFEGVSVAGGATFHYRQHRGDRGNHQDRFKAELQRKKWWEYDQMIFRRLYAELALADYLPPGARLEGREREAVLQRLTVMATKLLVPETLKDLQELSRMADDRPFTENERFLLSSLADPPYYRMGSFLDDRPFLKTFRELAAASPVIARLKKEIRKALLASLWKRDRRTRRMDAIKHLVSL